MSGISVAIVGATGAIGEALIETLEESELCDGELYLLASEASIGETRLYKNRPLLVGVLESFDFAQAQIAFFAVPPAVSRQYAESVLASGCRLLDFSGCFGDDNSVPMVVVGVNDHNLAQSTSNIVALPSSMAQELSYVVNAICREVEIIRINVTALQSVSGAGRLGVRELARQTSHLLNGIAVENDLFAEQIAFNVISRVGNTLASGYTEAEERLIGELRRIVGEPHLAASATCTYLPVFYGSYQSVNVETRYPLEVEQISRLLAGTDALQVLAEDKRPGSKPTPAIRGTNFNRSVERIRTLSVETPTVFDLWLSLDNVYGSVATNAVAAAGLLLKDSL
jgi:aspartate-semialdehyde dehydrogenase